MGIAAAGEIIKGNAAGASQEYQAQVATNNALIMKRNSDAALTAGSAAESASRFKYGQLKSEQTAGYAANGVDVWVGTPGRIAATTQDVSDLDALTIRYNAARQAYGYQTEANSATAQAQLDRMGAKQARVGGYFNAFNSIIGSAESVAKAVGGA